MTFRGLGWYETCGLPKTDFHALGSAHTYVKFNRWTIMNMGLSFWCHALARAPRISSDGFSNSGLVVLNHRKNLVHPNLVAMSIALQSRVILAYDEISILRQANCTGIGSGYGYVR